MSIVFHYAAGPSLTARLAHHGAIVCPEDDNEAFSAAMQHAEVLWHVLKPCTRAVISAAPNLKLIQKIGVGVNTIDLEAAAARGIAVCNLPGTNAPAVAEMTLLLMLATLRRLPQLDSALRRGVWSCPPDTQDQLGELSGRTVGLVGYGSVPRALAPILTAMGCRLLYTAQNRKTDVSAEYRPFADLLAEADIVSLHLPLTPETNGLINHAALQRMRRGSILINTARGGLIDSAALHAALASGHLAAAGLDVFAEEPPRRNDPLLTLPNVVVTPHVAWLTDATFERSLAIAAENVVRLRTGQPLLNRVA